MDVFKEFKEKIEESASWLKKELSSIQTGRATAAILDDIRIDSYGSKMPISQTATITTEGPRTLRVVPWDNNLVKEIEKAITTANLGVSVGSDDTGIRVNFPELTSERREQMKKVVRQKLEHAKVSIRGERDEMWHTIQKKEKEKEIGEDEKFRLKETMEKIVSDANTALDQLTDRKEREISS